MAKQAHLPDRAVLAVSGSDRLSFLQGLVSNDVNAVAPGRAVWTALLTPQGRLIAEFFLFDDGAADRVLLDVERGASADLVTRLSRFRLRAKVAVEATDLAVAAAWDGNPEVGGDAVVAADPRLPEAGFRVLSAAPLPANARFGEWDTHRLRLGLPDGSRDLDPGRTLLLEAGFAELDGVSWTKGCYMGQELTARTRYRGLLKRRLLPVIGIEGELPPRDTPLMRDDREVGSMRSSRDGIGLALVGIGLEGSELSHPGGWLRVGRPDWLPSTEAAETGA